MSRPTSGTLRGTSMVITAVLVLLSCGNADSSTPATDVSEIATSTMATSPSKPPTTLAPSTTNSTVPEVQGPEAGDVALCNDGGYSDNKDFSATCSGGDGIQEWLATYALCTNFEVVRLTDERSCDGGKSGFERLLADDEPLAVAIDALGLSVWNSLRCVEVAGPQPVAGLDAFSCTSASGGEAFAVGTSGSTPFDIVKALQTDATYSTLASTFVIETDTNVVIYAPDDFEFWGEGGPDWDHFDAVDTDCLNPGVDDPRECGPAPGAIPDLFCVRLDFAEDQLDSLGLPDPETIDATGADRSVFLAENWVVTSQSPEAFQLVSDQILLAVVKTDDPQNPC